MNDSLWTFAFEIANFVALAAVLAWLFFKPVRQAIADQQAKMQQLEDVAEKKLADAENLKNDAESRRQNLASELETMRTQLRETAKQEAEKILAEARAQAERERAAIKRDALRIEQAQTARIAKAVASATHDTIKRFMHQLEGPELEYVLTKAACREFQTLSNDSTGPVTIESAAPLNEDIRQLIESTLGGSATMADYRVVPNLEGGLRIATAHGLIDATVSGLASFAEQALAAELESLIREDPDNG